MVAPTAMLAALATVIESATPTNDATQVPVVVLVDRSKLVKISTAAEDCSTGLLTGNVYTPLESVAGPLTMVPGAMPGPETVVIPGATMLLIPVRGVAPVTEMTLDPAV